MSDPRIVFTEANLVDGKSPARPGSTVVVSGARIERVGAGKVETHPGDRVIPLGGRTLMPGMVQGHFHSTFGAFGDGISAPCLGLEAAPGYLAMLAVQSALVFHGYALLFSSRPLAAGYMRLRRWFEATFALAFGYAGFRILTARLQ